MSRHRHSSRLILALTASVVVLSFVGTSVVAALTAVDFQQGPTPTEVQFQVKTLYAQGRFDEAQAVLRKSLERNPADTQSRSLLVLVLLKAGDEDAARTEYELLKLNAKEPRTASFLSQLDQLFSQRQRYQTLRAELGAALASYNATGAADLIHKAGLAGDSQHILQYYLDAYRGDFTEARNRVAKLQDQAAAGDLIGDLMSRQETLQEYGFATLPFFTGEDRTSAPPKWHEEFLRIHEAERLRKSDHEKCGEFELARFAELVTNLQRSVPLHPLAIKANLLGALVFEQYPEFERLADVLAKLGPLTFPVTQLGARESRLLVINALERTVSLTAPRTGSSVKYPPFTIGFDQIKEIKQSAEVMEFQSGKVVVTDLEVLVMKPYGRVPMLTFGDMLGSAYGPAAEVEPMRKLARYIGHLLNNPRVKVEPLKLSVGSGANFQMIMSGLTAILAQQNGDMVAAAAATEKQQEAMRKAAQSKASLQEARRTSDAFALQAQQMLNFVAFKELDQLIAKVW